MSKNVQKKSNQKKRLFAGICVVIMLVIALTFYLDGKKGEKLSDGNQPAQANENKQAVVEDSDIVIPISDITEKASYYPAKINGTNLEVLAVEAPDGTIRTAFNTCQVCFSSGRGYYVQEGDALICQNCGNRFRMDDVEVTRGGCNPVPITSEYKSVDSENITISKEFLTEATVIFENWKN